MGNLVENNTFLLVHLPMSSPSCSLSPGESIQNENIILSHLLGLHQAHSMCQIAPEKQLSVLQKYSLELLAEIISLT